MVSEKLLAGQEGGFHPPSVSVEEAAPPAFVSAKVLTIILTMALPVSRRSHTGQRAGARVLQAAQSPEEVAPLETNESVRDLVFIGRIQAEPIQSVDAVHEAQTRGGLADLDGPQLFINKKARRDEKGPAGQGPHPAEDDPQELLESMEDVAAPRGLG